MASDNLTREEIRRMAGEIGLARLTEAQLDELLRATRVAHARRDTLPTASLAPGDEPAHVYCLAAEGRS